MFDAIEEPMENEPAAIAIVITRILENDANNDSVLLINTSEHDRNILVLTLARRHSPESNAMPVFYQAKVSQESIHLAIQSHSVDQSVSRWKAYFARNAKTLLRVKDTTEDGPALELHVVDQHADTGFGDRIQWRQVLVEAGNISFYEFIQQLTEAFLHLQDAHIHKEQQLKDTKRSLVSWQQTAHELSQKHWVEEKSKLLQNFMDLYQGMERHRHEIERKNQQLQTELCSAYQELERIRHEIHTQQRSGTILKSKMIDPRLLNQPDDTLAQIFPDDVVQKYKQGERLTDEDFRRTTKRSKDSPTSRVAKKTKFSLPGGSTVYTSVDAVLDDITSGRPMKSDTQGTS